MPFVTIKSGDTVVTIEVGEERSSKKGWLYVKLVGLCAVVIGALVFLVDAHQVAAKVGDPKVERNAIAAVSEALRALSKH